MDLSLPATPLPPGLPESLAPRLATCLAWIEEHEASASTRRQQRQRWARWCKFLATRGTTWDLAEASDVIAWMLQQTKACFVGGEVVVPEDGMRARSLRSVLYQVSAGYERTEMPNPVKTRPVRAVLEGLIRTDGRPVRRRDPVLVEDLRLMVSRPPEPTVIELRNRAGLLIHALTREPLAVVSNLGRGDLILDSDTLQVNASDGSEHRLEANPDRLLCPVAATAALLAAVPADVHRPFGVKQRKDRTLVYEDLASNGLDLTFRQFASGTLGVRLPGAIPDANTGLLRRLSAHFSVAYVRWVRDVAMACVGWAGGLRSCEIAAMRWEHLFAHDLGLVLFIPRSKTDQEARGDYAAIPRATRPENGTVCPIRALEAWRALCGNPTTGWVFPSSRREDAPLRADRVDTAVKRLTSAAQMPGLWGGHALRRGWATSAAEAGRSLLQIAAGGRWASVQMAAGYVDTAEATEIIDTMGDVLGGL